MSRALELEIILTYTSEEDAEHLAQISKQAFHSDVEVGGEAGKGPPGYDSPEFQIQLMKWCDYHKILYRDYIVGGLIISRKRPGHYECARIFIEPKYHNTGIATRAFELAFTMYTDAKIWTLGTPEWNVRTKHFYEKLGFIQIGWTKEAEHTWRGRYYQKRVNLDQPYSRMEIKQLREGMKEVEIDAQVLNISKPKEVFSRKTGEVLRVAEAMICDETGKIALSLWNDQISQVKVNDRIRINSGYVTSYRGRKQLNLSNYDPLVILISD